MPSGEPFRPIRFFGASFLSSMKRRVWLAERLQLTELQRTLLWAGLIGILGGLTSALFRQAIYFTHYLLTRHTTDDIVKSFTNLAGWQRVMIPALGGLMAGLVMLLARRKGKEVITTTDYMEAVVVGGGILSARRSLVKVFSSLFSIASGASIGREGPMVQLSSLCASQLGRWRRWPTPRRRLMVACGAAAGIAAAYNAPIAGALFVAEILLGSIAMETFGPLVFASVLSTQTLRYLRGSSPLYDIPPFRMVGEGWELILFVVLGILCGLLAPWFLRSLRFSEKIFTRLSMPAVFKICFGGLIVGAVAYFYPGVCGNGYGTVSEILREQWTWKALLVLFVLKIAATCATFGSGAVGGVFTPTLFAGAGIGYLFGVLVPHFWPWAAPHAGAMALCGMGMFLAATTHAPLMAILMIFEMTLDYQIILPLMLGCVVSYYAAQGLDPRSIYSGSLERKGFLAFNKRLAHLNVGDLMHRNPLCVEETARFSEIARAFIANSFKYLYVVDREGHYKGAIALQDLKEYLNMPELANLVIARELTRDTVPVTQPGARLSDTLNLFAQHDGERIPVLSGEAAGVLVGSISKNDLLLAMVDQKKTGKE